MKRYQWKMVQEDKASRLLFLLCWFAYFSAYLGRLNYSVALAGMVESQMFSKPDAGLIGTTYFLMYGIGQIVNGFLGDRLSPFKMVFCGLLFSALSNLFMGLCSSFVLMAGIWGVNGLAQSMLWSPILAIFANMLQNQHRQKACIHISTTVPAGTLVSYLLSVWVMSNWGWQSVFFVAFAALIFAVTVWVLGSIKITKGLTDASLAQQVGFSPSLRQAQKETASKKGSGLWPLLFGSGVLLMMLPVAIQGILKDGVATWIPTMISETFSVSSSFAVILTMTLPFANLLGAYAGNFCNKKWLRNEMVTSCVFFLLCLSGLVLLLMGGIQNIWVSILMLCLISFSMHAINVMLITFVPIRFSVFGKSSTVSGLLNSTAYVGCAISTYGIGYLAEKTGWFFTVLVWAVICVVALLFSLLSVKPWKEFSSWVDTRERNPEKE